MEEVAQLVEATLPNIRPLEHHAPSLGQAEHLAAGNGLGQLHSNIFQDALADQLAKYVGVNHVIPVASGTAAITLALLSVGLKPGEEVIVPSLTFAATAAAVVHAGGVPHFVDGTLGINSFKLRQYLASITAEAPNKRGRLNVKSGRVISGIVSVDLLGYPADYAQLSMLAKEFGLFLIEDSAEALGYRVNGKMCGSFGNVGIFSFNNNKIVTAGGGGAIVTNDEWAASAASNLASACRINHPWLVEHDGIGFNYRMPSLNAAICCAQLKKIDGFLSAKRALFERYKAAMGSMLEPSEWHGTPNYWLSTYLAKNVTERDELLKALHKRQIRARALFTPLHRLEPYKAFPRQVNMMQAEDLFAKAVCLPSGAGALQCR